ncbi:MAG TPA: hypothetical protein PLD47_10430 [Aggregatilineales bacterium]|nr:hypothetical protein [Anaerolineales bacterium]HRE48131.1 hypothetical protein [Aggregatilineales bacterium]
MKRTLSLIVVLVVLVSVSLVLPIPAKAVNAISGIALNSSSDCTRAGIDLTITMDGTATREAGSASIDGSMFYSFEQSTGLGGFSGTFTNYNYPFPDQPANTIITIDGYIGSTPPDSNTVIWTLTYNCTTKAVLDYCYGVGPDSCGAVFSGPGLPANRNLVLITSDTAVFSEPGGKSTGEVLKTCQTAFVLDTSDDGKYGRIYVMGGWIPLANTADVPEEYGQAGFPVAPGCEGR